MTKELHPIDELKKLGLTHEEIYELMPKLQVALLVRDQRAIDQMLEKAWALWAEPEAPSSPYAGWKPPSLVDLVGDIHIVRAAHHSPTT